MRKEQETEQNLPEIQSLGRHQFGRLIKLNIMYSLQSILIMYFVLTNFGEVLFLIHRYFNIFAKFTLIELILILL